MTRTLAATYALAALLAAATLTLPGARTTLIAGWHVIPAAAEPFTDWRVWFLLACLVVLGAAFLSARATEVRPIARWRGIEPGEEVAEYGVGGR